MIFIGHGHMNKDRDLVSSCDDDDDDVTIFSDGTEMARQ
jgi:hypothetical protein